MSRKVPTEPVRVPYPSWTRKGPQVWHDAWRNADRILRFKGDCVVCGRRTYAFDDGENDPRGILGDRAASPMVAEEYGQAGPDVPACFLCMNDYDRYKIGVRIAEARWALDEAEAEAE